METCILTIEDKFNSVLFLEICLLTFMPEFNFMPRTVVELGEHLNALRVKYVESSFIVLIWSSMSLLIYVIY